MNDDELKAAVDDILSRKKGPIELAFEEYERSAEVYHGALHATGRTWRSRGQQEYEQAYLSAKAALAQALWGAWKSLDNEIIVDGSPLTDLKSLAMALMPRGKIEEALKAKKL